MPIHDALEALTSLLGERFIRSNPDLAGPAAPAAIAQPGSAAEVQALVRVCAAHGCALNLAGAAAARPGRIAVDLGRLDRLVALDPADLAARVQPGLRVERLESTLRGAGLTLPAPGPARAGETLGEMAAGGAVAGRVAGLRAVLADGSLLDAGGTLGSGLAELILNARGALGLVTELDLRLAVQSEAAAAGLCRFGRLSDAAGCAADAVQAGMPAARLVFWDAAASDLLNAYAGAGLDRAPHLAVALEGTPAAVAEARRRFAALGADHGARIEWIEDRAGREALWTLLGHGRRALARGHPHAQVLERALSVPLSRLAETAVAAAGARAGAGLPGLLEGAAAPPGLRLLVAADPARPAEREQARALAHRIAALSAPPAAAAAAMAQIKRALDPRGVLPPLPECEAADWV